MRQRGQRGRAILGRERGACCDDREKGGKASNYRTPLAAAIRETAAGLHRIGLMDDATMREFDRLSLASVEPRSAKAIARARCD